MKDGATDSFVQGYNAQAVADSHAQVIVACGVTQAAGDVEQFGPMLSQVQANTGQAPATATADAGFFSEANLVIAERLGVDVYIPPDRERHGLLPGAGPPGRSRTGRPSERMRDKLRTPAGETIYRRRKAIIEPVFAYIKAGRGFRRFSLRGVGKVTAEWTLICLTHNLLKLFRAQAPAPA